MGIKLKPLCEELKYECVWLQEVCWIPLLMCAKHRRTQAKAMWSVLMFILFQHCKSNIFGSQTSSAASKQG